MKILKAKVKDYSVEVVFSDQKKQVTEGILKFSDIPHPDLINAMNNLRKHLVVLCDQRESDIVISDEFSTFEAGKLPDIKVTGISIGGDEEYEGVTITGQRILKNRKVVNLNTPFTFFTDPVEENYQFEEYLFEDVSMVLVEVEAYINGKRAIKEQELPFAKSENTAEPKVFINELIDS